MVEYKTFFAAIGLLVYGLNGNPVRASILGVTGATEVVSMPADWHRGMYESSQWVRVFCYECGGVLTETEDGRQPLPGIYPGLNGVTFNSFPSTTYPAGTGYDFWIIHLDPVGATQVVRQGSITFSGPILYITDSPDRSPIHEPLEGGDWVILSADLRTLTYHLTAGGGVDEIAVAAAVPEPASVFLVASIVGLFWLRSRGDSIASSPARSSHPAFRKWRN